MSETGPREVTLKGMGNFTRITLEDAFRKATNLFSVVEITSKDIINENKFGLPTVTVQNGIFEEVVGKITVKGGFTDTRIEFTQLYVRLFGFYDDRRIKLLLEQYSHLYFKIIEFFASIIYTLNKYAETGADLEYKTKYKEILEILKVQIDNANIIQDIFIEPDVPNTSNKPKLIRSSPKSTTPGITSVPKQMDLPKDINLETSGDYFDTFTSLETSDPKFVFVEIYGKMSQNDKQYREILIANRDTYEKIVGFFNGMLTEVKRVVNSVNDLHEPLTRDIFFKFSLKLALLGNENVSDEELNETKTQVKEWSEVFGKLVDVMKENEEIIKRLKENGIIGGKSKKHKTKTKTRKPKKKIARKNKRKTRRH